jgi:hypothetical protein
MDSDALIAIVAIVVVVSILIKGIRVCKRLAEWCDNDTNPVLSERARMTRAKAVYGCPHCGSTALSQASGPSILDKKCRWKCDSCSKLLGTKRSTALLIAYLVVCLIATIGAWALALFCLVAQADPRGLGVKLILLGAVGMFLGPVAIVMVCRDLFAARPRRVRQRQQLAAPEKAADYASLPKYPGR